MDDRLYYRNSNERPPICPHSSYVSDLPLPITSVDRTGTMIFSRFYHTAVNKEKSEIISLSFIPGGRWLLTGSKSGNISIWNSHTLQQEKLLKVFGTIYNRVKMSL